MHAMQLIVTNAVEKLARNNAQKSIWARAFLMGFAWCNANYALLRVFLELFDHV